VLDVPGDGVGACRHHAGHSLGSGFSRRVRAARSRSCWIIHATALLRLFVVRSQGRPPASSRPWA
jgi:hypothetical protein